MTRSIEGYDNPTSLQLQQLGLAIHALFVTLLTHDTQNTTDDEHAELVGEANTFLCRAIKDVLPILRNEGRDSTDQTTTHDVADFIEQALAAGVRDIRKMRLQAKRTTEETR